MSGAQPGALLVRAAKDVHGALLAHAGRRLRAAGLGAVEAHARVGAPLFREVATRLGIAALPTEPEACAEVIALAVASARVALLVDLPNARAWDDAVAAELARVAQTKGAFVVFVSATEAPFSCDEALEIPSDLDASDKLRWLSALADHAHDDLRSLEAWWTQAQRIDPDAPHPPWRGSEGASTLAVRLALAGRVLPLSAAAALDEGGGIDELRAAGVLAESDGLVVLAHHVDVRALEERASSHDRRTVAELLKGDVPGTGFEPDPWAHARAAELLLDGGMPVLADLAFARATKSAPHALDELSLRWHRCLARSTDPSAARSLRLRAAERALAAGEANQALRWCESAQGLASTDPDVVLLTGRAFVQLGDLVAARVSLGNGEALASEDETRARFCAELAEVAYLAGDLQEARRRATTAFTLATTDATRLAGRNTLGKLHLAEGRWAEADEHFAADVLTAAASGDAKAELRARLNRAIALMSNGLLDEAKDGFARVLETGSELAEDRARAHALANLGVIAYRKHDYAEALAHWEATTRFPQALRGRIASARTLANLAELRLRLGLVDHAEHAIAFGRRVLGGRAAAAASAHLAVVAAHIAIARGNTALARREIESALADARTSNDVGDKLPEAHLVAARIALEDGDRCRAEEGLEAAARIVTNKRGHAEVAILRAHLDRAAGRSALEAANEALGLARASGEEDLLAEIHALLASIHRDAGDLSAARSHCGRAMAVRDQVATSLPGEIRTAFLAKPEMVALSRLSASIADEPESAPASSEPLSLQTDSEPRSVLPPMPSQAREMVGEDPQMRSLAVAIKKVARANGTVLIRGESGTGKELVAEALHYASDRASGPLVSVNCAALVETLLLSELFGHEKGAFTGAGARRRGRFELAEGGTLFLDEIGDISPRTQVSLLRVLQEKTFERVGGATAIHANVRVVCATHRDLRAMVERGTFREDLYYRLHGLTLEVPALRARLGDLPKLSEHLLRRIAEERNEPRAKVLAPDAIELLQRHRWPGNIRELENVLRAVSLFADGDAITTSDLIENVDDLRAIAASGPTGPASQPPRPLRAAPSAPLWTLDEEDGEGALPDGEARATAVAYAHVRQGAVSLGDMKRQIERDCIVRALAETKGNITRAAALLGMKRPRLSQLVKQYGLSASSEGSQ